METFLNRLLTFYKMSEEEYQASLFPFTFADIPSYPKESDMDKAVARIKKAIDNNEKIFIYGDYDADGILATSILVYAFKKLGKEVGYYVPSRYIDGYALTTKRVEEAKEKGYSLIITVDNGVSANEAVNLATSLGIDVIITDHHEKGEELPNYYALIHPIFSSYGKVVTSGAYVAYMLASELLGEHNPYLTVLAGISTISDLMVMKDYNKGIVKLSLELLNSKDHYFYEINYLANWPKIYDDTTLSMTVVPKINAIGRIVETTSINKMVKFFTCEDRETIDKIGYWINETNDERKELSKSGMEEIEKIDENLSSVVVIKNIKEGLIGIEANRYLNKYNKPAVVFTTDSKDDSIYKGSARSKNGFSLVKAFKSMEDILETSGGHKSAGGLSLKKENLPVFIKRFEELACTYKFQEEADKIMEVSLTDISKENYDILQTFAPFGMGHESPIFLIKNIKVSALKFMSNDQHFNLPISLKSKIVGFNHPRKELSPYNFIDCYGKMSVNTFRGDVIIQLVVNEVTPHN